MATVRSPGYPSVPLRDAILRIRDLYDHERHNPMNREAAAKLLGYSGISGSSNKMLADLIDYGLLERVSKGEVRVSRRVAELIHPTDRREYATALRETALSPSLFSALRERFPDHLPTTATLEGALIRMGFSKAAVKPAMQAFLDTFRYLQEEIGSESHGQAAVEGSVSEAPDTKFGSATIGDLIQWESNGALRLERPSRVRWVSEDGAWVAVEGSDTGIPMNEVIVETPSAAAPPPQMPPSIPQTSRAAPPQQDGFTEWFRAKVGPDKLVTIHYKGEEEIGPKEIEKMIAILEAQKAALQD